MTADSHPRVVITGATGFIGAPAVRAAIRRGCEVHAISHSMPREPEEGVIQHQIDLLGGEEGVRKRIAEIGATHLLHLAWCAEPGTFWTSPENVRWVRATSSLAEAFSAASGTRFVGAGTCAEYDWRFGFCSEDVTPCEPATPYGIAKDTTRRLLDAQLRAAQVSFAWGRVAFLYGPREHPDRLVASVIRSLLLGEIARTTHARQIRDFLHVDDVADALVALLLSDVEGAVNIASGEPVAIRTLLDFIAEEIGGSGHLAIGTLSPREEPSLIVADVRRLRELVGWTPRFTLESGLRDTIDWWRAGIH